MYVDCIAHYSLYVQIRDVCKNFVNNKIQSNINLQICTELSFDRSTEYIFPSSVFRMVILFNNIFLCVQYLFRQTFW